MELRFPPSPMLFYLFPASEVSSRAFFSTPLGTHQSFQHHNRSAGWSTRKSPKNNAWMILKNITEVEIPESKLGKIHSSIWNYSLEVLFICSLGRSKWEVKSGVRWGQNGEGFSLSELGISNYCLISTCFTLFSRTITNCAYIQAYNSLRNKLN